LEEEKLLRILRLSVKFLFLFFVCGSLSCASVYAGYASDSAKDLEDNAFYKDLADKAKSLVIKDSKIVMKDFTHDPNGGLTIDDNAPNHDNNPLVGQLYVFVSFSMRDALLREYMHEAEKYNALLVFRGLPSGSFRELSDNIVRINQGSEDIKFGAIIDDSKFAEFNITKVPSFVLEEVKDEAKTIDASRKARFDKLEGNIGIKAALDIFASSGELKALARHRLENSNKEVK
jgi:type-F conjugative transfer system pilin assembly protein TrbC